MLSDHPAIPVLAVSDVDRARSFYEGTLGFADPRVTDDGVLYAAASGAFLVYPSSYAGTNKATGISFQLPGDAFDTEVAALRDKGIAFQTFDFPGATWQDGVLTMPSGRAIWFADPDGNILNVETEAASS